MVSVYPARRCTSPLGVVPAGLGDGVGDCHDVANFLEKWLFTSLFFSFWWRKLYSFFFRAKVSFISVLPGMLVAKREPTSCYRDAYSVDTPTRAIWEKGWQQHGETAVSPLLGRFFLVS